MRLRKKGDLSVNLIIMAILALLVLVIMSLIFTGRINIFRQSADSCSTGNVGTCVVDASLCSGQYQAIDTSRMCDLNRENDPGSPDDGICCIST